MNDEKRINWKKIRACGDGLEAQLLRNLMEINDIPVRLLNVDANNLFPDSYIADVVVEVPETYFDEAEKIIVENFDD